MKKLLIATSNQGKLAEYRKFLGDLPLELLSLSDFNLGSIDETGKTFEENAKLKAESYFKMSGLPCISDDGGLEIDALGGAPGMLSRRWKTGDENVTDEELIAYTLERMKDVEEGKRGARFRLVAAFYDGERMHSAGAVTEGSVVSTPPRFNRGFPFSALLYIPKFGKMYDDLSQQEHEAINHRFAAVSKLKSAIQKALVG